MKNGQWAKLQIRYATDKDVKDQNTKGSESRYYKYNKHQQMKNQRYQKPQGKYGNKDSSFQRKGIQKEQKLGDNHKKEKLIPEDEGGEIEIKDNAPVVVVEVD